MNSRFSNFILKKIDTWDCQACGLISVSTKLIYCLCGIQRPNPILKVFTCVQLFNLIKDFGGILCEYPLSFLYKNAPKPRTWGFKWWLNPKSGANRFLVPSKKNKFFKIFVQKEDVCNGLQRIVSPNFKACDFDEFHNAWPVDLHYTRGKHLEKKWSRVKNIPLCSKLIGFSVQSLATSIVDILCVNQFPYLDDSAKEASFETLKERQVNFKFIFWYVETFPLLKNHDKWILNYVVDHSFRFIPFKNLNYFTTNHLLWLQSSYRKKNPNLCFNNPQLAYHCGLLSLEVWGKNSSNLWASLSWFFNHQLFGTIRKFLLDYFNYWDRCCPQEKIQWDRANNDLERARFIYENCPSHFFEKFHVHFDEANEEIIDYFIGKVQFGLFDWFFSKLCKSKTLNTILKVQSLLQKSWAFFKISEKEMFLKQFFILLSTPHFVLKVCAPDFLIETNDWPSIYSFLKNLLQNDRFEGEYSLFASECNLNYKNVFQQFCRYMQRNEPTISCSYLHILIDLNQTKN